MAMTEEDLGKDAAQAGLAGRSCVGAFIRPGDIFRHYKGGLYSVVCVSVMEDTLETLVTYHSNRKGTDRTRTMANFLEQVEITDPLDPRQRVPRFRRLED
jgi:hypothetical protein